MTAVNAGLWISELKSERKGFMDIHSGKTHHTRRGGGGVSPVKAPVIVLFQTRAVPNGTNFPLKAPLMVKMEMSNNQNSRAYNYHDSWW